NPGALGTRDEFVREWCTGTYGDEKKIADPRAFGEYLRREGLMIRRTRSDVGRELPPLTKVPQFVDSDRRALDRIKGSAVELAKTILAAQQNYKGEKMLAAEEFNVLMRQATGIAKAPYVAEFVRLLLEGGEKKIVLYGWHREVYGIWLQLLKDYNPRLYTGTESPKQKDEAKKAFIEEDCRLLIVSLRAGAGMDGLQRVCRTVVVGELDWSPGVHEQNIGRVYRDEQEDPVMAYFLISEEGSDPIIADVLGIKRGQIEGVRDPNAELIEKLETDTGNVKRLAEAYLKRVGVVWSEATVSP
ncbi:MAG TPA: helicase SNF2, partial [Nitrospiraceae bacterium]|nr:helicase SNF2 [Nitrospiraceae bacterium]